GLYGLLRPLDLMQAYRLEMGTSFTNERGRNLYEFWGSKISKSLNKQLKKLGSTTLLNLASNEYFKSVDIKSLDAQIVTPVFKDWKNDKYKVISFFAKKARGRMASYIIKNGLTAPEQILDFDCDGYSYSESMSLGTELVFTRRVE
ncbi:MAG: peroxide stress protein YaaA, partial [Kofleriaceae bacterium]|nr:peroxide stress protein YaaA [Kofleriaceae bacterium]